MYNKKEKQISSVNVNIDYYDNLYKKRNILYSLVYPFVSFNQQSKSKANFQIIKHLVKKGKSKKILDYGFGHGSLLLKFSRDLSLYGCDISLQAVNNFPKIANLINKKVTTFHPKEFNDVIRNEFLDIVCTSHVLEHVPDDLHLLKELVKKTKINGHVLLNLPINEVWEDPKHIHKYSEERILDMLDHVGLSVILIKYAGRINGYFLTKELNSHTNLAIRFFIKMSKMILAMLPYSLFNLIEEKIFKSKTPTHIITLAQK